MNINNSTILIHLFDPIGKNSFPLKDALIVKDIESLTIQDSCVHLASTVNIVVPFALGFLFHNNIGYKYIKIIQQDNTNSEERCIWWGKVNSIGRESSIKDNTITIVGMSFSDTYNHVAVDHQSYKNNTVKNIFQKNSQIICKDALHGSRSSVMSMSDIVFVPKTKDYNPVLESFIRSVGQTSTSVLKNLLSKASLYIFSTMYQGQPKIIVNSLPIIPDGEYGFEVGASYLAKDKTLTGVYSLDKPAHWNVDNIKNISFTGDYTIYRDRIRILIDDNKEHWSANPELANYATDRVTKDKKKLALAPFVPMVISRENISQAEAENISKAIWNDINSQSSSFNLEVVGWQLFGVDLDVGRIINFNFTVSNPYINPTSTDIEQKENIVFQINDEMIVTECTRKYSLKGFTSSITLVTKDSFSNEKIKTKKNMFKESDSSYYTGYEGQANADI